MKRLLTIACALALCVGVCGCSSQQTAASGSASAATSEAALADGVYAISVDTDSSMVNVVDAKLTVDGGAYTVTMSLNGEGFSRLYLGKAEDAEAAGDVDVYDYRLDDAGKYTFDFPVGELETDTDVALFGHRRDTWYDHVLVFHAPTGEPLSTGSAAVFDLAEGEHTIEVALEGGSGKATVESPAKIAIGPDGSMTATIVWSSPNYDLMIVDGEEYLPVPRAGNSTFVIPIAALDEALPIQAETTAMSEPHLIDYTLRFDSGTMS